MTANESSNATLRIIEQEWNYTDKGFIYFAV